MSVVTSTTAGRTRVTTASTGSWPEGRLLVSTVAAEPVAGALDPTVNEHALATIASTTIGRSNRRIREPPKVVVTRVIRERSLPGSTRA